jgi:hypothetical protein
MKLEISSIVQFFDELQKYFCIIGVLYFFCYLQQENEKIEKINFGNKRRNSL